MIAKKNLDGHVRKVDLEDWDNAQAFNLSYYVKSEVNYVEEYFKRIDIDSPSKEETPTRIIISPEIDVSPELGPTDNVNCQSLIGIIICII